MFKALAAVFLMVAVACVAFVPQADATTGDAASIEDRNYPTLEEALASSVEGDTVFLLKDYAIWNDITVPKGVSLVIPYSDELDEDGTMDGPDMESTTEKLYDKTKLYRTLTVPSGITINVEGELIVGGVLSRPFHFDYQGHTSGAYAEIRNNGSIVVQKDGILRCYGYIMGTGIVECESGSTVYEPFIITEYVGGDFAYIQYENKQSPFDRYAVLNIQNEFRMQYGATLMGMANLYADESYNKVDVTLIGVTEGLIRLLPGASYTSTYQSEAGLQEDWESNVSSDIGRKNITISGGAEAGSISISFQDETANTNRTVFSIPYNFSFTLEKGTYTLTDSFRLLPGATVTVEADATLVVSDELQVFPALYSTEFRDKHYPRPETLRGSMYFTESAELFLKGTMIVEGTFLGTVSGVPGALIHVREGADVSEQRVYHGAWGSFGGESIKNLSMFYLSGYLFASDGSKIPMVPGETCQIVDTLKHPMGTFEYSDLVEPRDGSILLTTQAMGSWVSSAFTIDYDINGGYGDIPVDKTPYAQGQEAIILGEVGAYKVRHEFKEWNTSPDGTGTAYHGGDVIVMNDDIHLHAIWTYVGGEGHYVIYHGNIEYEGYVPRDLEGHASEATILGPGTMMFEGHEFKCWNTASDGRGTSYEEGDVIRLTEDVELYAMWEIGTYMIQFDTGGGDPIENIVATYGETITAPDEPEKEGHTFMGWYPELPDTMPWKGMIVTAQWKVNEYQISFDTGGGSEIDAMIIGFGTTVRAPENPTWYGYRFLGWTPELPETMPSENISVTAMWEELPFFDIKVEVTGNGTADPEQCRHPLDYKVSIHLIPEDGFSVGHVELDGKEVPPTAIQNITVSSNHILSVEFVPAPGTTTTENEDGTVSTKVVYTEGDYDVVYTVTESSEGIISTECAVTLDNLTVVSLVKGKTYSTTGTVVLNGDQATMERTSMDLLMSMKTVAENKTGGPTGFDLVVSAKDYEQATLPKVDVDSLTVECKDVSITLPGSVVDTLPDSTVFDLRFASDDDMNESQRKAAGPMKVVSLKINGKDVSEFGGTATVSVKYTPEGWVSSVDRLKEDGSTEPCKFKVKDGQVTFTTDGMSLYRITDDGVHESSKTPWMLIGIVVVILLVVGLVAYNRLKR